MVEQSDLAPTIAALLGFPASKNNLGACIPDFLPFWNKASDKVQILVRNARQILQIVTAAFGSELFTARGTADPCYLEATDLNELACEWRRISESATTVAEADELDPAWLSSISTWLRKAQDLMSSMASNYDMSRLFIGQVLGAVAVLSSIFAVTLGKTREKCALLPLFLITISYGVMMFASSYVEEEHHFWYWSSTLWMAYLGARNIQR